MNYFYSSVTHLVINDFFVLLSRINTANAREHAMRKKLSFADSDHKLLWIDFVIGEWRWIGNLNLLSSNLI